MLFIFLFDETQAIKVNFEKKPSFLVKYTNVIMILH